MILVTGGTGLVGSHLLYRLAASGEKVRALYRTSARLGLVKNVFSYFTSDVDALFNTIEWAKGDINDIPSLNKAFEGITDVYHAAAFVSFYEKEHKKLRKVNIEGTANVVNCCIAFQVKKLCYVSSVATLGNNTDYHVTEQTHWNTAMSKSSYAITKYGAEMEVWRGTQEGLDTVIVNPGVILGAGFWNSGSGKIFTIINNGFLYYTEGVMGFVDVEDVVKAMIALMESAITNKRYILVAENWSYKKLLFHIAENLEVKPPQKKIYPWVLKLLWRLATWKSGCTADPPSLTKYHVTSLLSNRRYSSKRIENALDFKFTPFPESIKNIGNRFMLNKFSNA